MYLHSGHNIYLQSSDACHRLDLIVDAILGKSRKGIHSIIARCSSCLHSSQEIITDSINILIKYLLRLTVLHVTKF